MSALRLPGPDGRTILVPIDDGAVGRVSHSRGPTFGGVIVVATPSKWENRPSVEQTRFNRRIDIERRLIACGAPMRYGEECGRTPGHSERAGKGDHRSRKMMDADNERRRKLR